MGAQRQEHDVAAAARIGAFELLEESERLWASNPVGALRGEGSVDSRHRRKLVIEALRAYDRLRVEQAPAADPLVVFRRWPACTLVATVALAAADSHAIAEHWVRGWAECWQQLLNIGDRLDPHEVAGLSQLLTRAGLTSAETAMPELGFDLERGVVVVRADPNASWRVEADAAGAATPAGERIVAGPTSTIACRDPAGTVHDLPCVNPDDPLLVFSADGAVIPPDRALPPGGVWLLHRGELTDVAFDGTWRIVQESPPPPGWAGWCLAEVDLAQTVAVRSADPQGASAPGPWREVRSLGSAPAAAELEFDTPVREVTDLHGKPVYAAVPRLLLPAGTWHITARLADANDPARRHTQTGPLTLTLAQLLPRPAVGRFHVHVEGTGTTPIDSTFTVVEGLAVHADVRLRLFRSDGTLYRGRVDRGVPAGWQAMPPAVRLSSGDVDAPVELRPSDSRAALRLRVKLPYAAIRKRLDRKAAAWAVSPLAYTLDELHHDAELDLDLPAEAREAWGAVPTLEARDQNGETVQHLDGHRVPGGGIFRYNLTRLADTARELGSVWLWLVLVGEDACIGTITVPPPARDAFCDGRSIRLVDRVRYQRLRVTVHSCYAPWVEPQTVELAEGVDEVELASPLRCGGPLLVGVFPVDVSASGNRPDALADGSKLFQVGDDSQVPALSNPAAAAVARYLAGHGPLPNDRAALPLLWVVSARATALFGKALGGATAHECASRLAMNPVAALSAAGSCGLSTTELVEPLVRSGICAQRLRAVTDPDQVRRMWSTTPLAALLLTSPLLAYLADSARWDSAELEPAEAALLDEPGRQCMPEALDVLAGNPVIEVTGLDSPFLTSQHASATPRVQPIETRETVDVDEALAELDAYAETSHYRPVFEGFITEAEDREQATSRGCSRRIALLARIAAQGERSAAALEQRLRPLWVDLAGRVPDLVATDLALAEFAVSGWAARNG